MFADRIAKTRNYSQIERVAERARILGRISGHSRFNIISFLDGPLRYSISCQLDFELYKKGEYSVPAFVKYCDKNKIILYAEETVWNNAKADFPEAKYIIAHEIGHILMHTHDELAFTQNNESAISSLPPEDRTESQANLFADLFLVPTNLLDGFTNPEDIEYYFDVPLGSRLDQHQKAMTAASARAES